MPRRAPTDVPTITAVGVARPRAHGHATTSEAQPNMKASNQGLRWPASSRRSRLMAPAPPATLHTTKVRMETRTTVGTKTRETRSANAWTATLRCCASAITWVIWESTVRLPVASTSTVSTPAPLIVPAITRSSSFLLTGRASPVSRASSTVDLPLTTNPSAGTPAPGSTLTTSPSLICLRGTSSASPPHSSQHPLRTRAEGGASVSSLEIAVEVRALASDSSILPRRMKQMSIAAVSKTSSLSVCPSPTPAPCTWAIAFASRQICDRP
mmetsp:Transcript_72326/g.143533  ORF Transcript_72326/g.143533 Transcript_72326/m.143533 type:complete len:269 (-) Transcript_72326:702-1508(-)